MTLVLAATLLTGPVPDAAFSASECDASASAGAGWYDTQLTCGDTLTSTADPSGPSNSTPSYYTAYRWTSACGLRDHYPTVDVSTCPSNTVQCPPGQTLQMFQGLHEGVWQDLGRECRPASAAGDPPPVTAADVLREFRRVPLPRLRSISQPAEKTLVNFATIFRVQAEPLRRTLTLAGQQVELAIEPDSFHWVYGDGTSETTRTPGRAYPHHDVVHHYQHAHVRVEHHVEVTWTAQWRLNNGPWSDVPGTVTTTGPTTGLRIAEATPTLTGESR